MSKKEKRILSESLLLEMYNALPESSKEYLLENFEHMPLEVYNAYITGLKHGMKYVLESMNEILHR